VKAAPRAYDVVGAGFLFVVRPAATRSEQKAQKAQRRTLARVWMAPPRDSIQRGPIRYPGMGWPSEGMNTVLPSGNNRVSASRLIRGQ